MRGGLSEDFLCRSMMPVILMSVTMVPLIMMTLIVGHRDLDFSHRRVTGSIRGFYGYRVNPAISGTGSLCPEGHGQVTRDLPIRTGMATAVSGSRFVAGHRNNPGLCHTAIISS